MPRTFQRQQPSGVYTAMSVFGLPESQRPLQGFEQPEQPMETQHWLEWHRHSNMQAAHCEFD
jgi:hypothetical protein